MFLKLEHINIGYHSPLIKDIYSSLDLGEICLIIGNNGVGKTTLIHSLLNQIPLLKGNIILNNKNLKNYSKKEIAKQIAVVFSKSNIPSHYKIQDLIALGKYIHSTFYFQLNEEEKAEISTIIDQLNLTQYKDLKLNKLSDGNFQKAMIARALVQNSPLIILDEPTTHLDEENKIMILKTLRKLAKEEKKLIIFSSHDWRLAQHFVDKIWYIKNGKLHSGYAQDILSSHKELSEFPNFEL